MASSQADSDTIAILRRLAEVPESVRRARQVQSDLVARGLQVGDVCQAIVDWIDAEGRVKPVTLHSFGGRVGQAAWEMKPRINGVLFYVKVTIDDRGGPEECLALLSAHPDH